MASDSGVSISDEVWAKWLAKFAAVSKQQFRIVLYEEWPLLIEKIISFTPPFATRATRGEGKTFSSSASDLSVGRKAVAFDIYKTMRPFDPKDIRSPALKVIVERKDIAAFNAFAERSGSAKLAEVEALPFDPGLHLRARDRRGRVPGRDRRIVMLGSDAGLLNKYVADVQKRVGYAKSGWLAALNLVGGDAPAYVRNKGSGGGEVIDNHADEENPSITAINRTPWAVRKDEGDRILADAKASRINAIIKKTRVAIFRSDEIAKSA
jgi:hypothetical protein